MPKTATATEPTIAQVPKVVAPVAVVSPVVAAERALDDARGEHRRLEAEAARVNEELRQLAAMANRGAMTPADSDRRKTLLERAVELTGIDGMVQAARLRVATLTAEVRKARKWSPPVLDVDEAERRLEAAPELLAALRAESVRLPGELRDAMLAGDADQAVAVQRRLDELPIRMRVAELGAVQAEMGVAAAEAAALQGEIDEASAAVETARERHATVVNDRSSSRADVEHALVTLEDASGRARRLVAEQKTRREKARDLSVRVEALVTPSRASSAPTVRSLPHISKDGA